MKKNMKTLLVLLGCLLATTAGYAQEVLKEGNKYIIDASAMLRHTTDKKARETDGTNSVRGANTAANIGSAVSDEKVYYKFELSPDRFTATWLNAVNRCKNLSNDNGGWRLPTQKEVILIYILWPELVQAGLTGEAGGTATESGGSANQCRYVLYDGVGTISSTPKNNANNYYRCIRDL